MKKKRHRKPLKKVRYSRKSWSRVNQLISKPFVLSASLVLSLLVFIYATYAWNTSADLKTNKFTGTQLSVRLDEVFEPNYQWNPGTQTTKIIRVTNTGEAAAFVRVSLDEYLATFQINTTDQHGDGNGNGNLVVTDTPTANPITFDNFKDWVANVPGKTYQVPNTDPPEYYLGEKGEQATGYQYPDGSTDRNATDFQYLSIQFTDRVKDTVADATDDAANGRKNNWFYHDGYFYFTSVLYAGETTTPLTNGVSVSASLPNALKGALYVLDVNYGGVDLMNGSLETGWKLDKTNDQAVFEVLNQYIQK